MAVAGTLTGPKQVEKLVGVDGLDLELPLAEHMLVLRYTDRPGVVGTVGGVLGAAGVNIGGMQVARATEGGLAVGVLTLDQTVPAGVVDDLVREIGADTGRLVDLSEQTPPFSSTLAAIMQSPSICSRPVTDQRGCA